MKDEDYAFETRRQKRIDQGAKPKIGSCSGVHRPERYYRQDRWPDVPFVDDDQQPPEDGLLALWGVCTALALLLSAYLIWGPK